jgi:DNA polymerase-3 subunit beta
MEFVIKKNDLVRELQTVTGVVEKRATIPILSNLLLETTKGGLQVGASDLEVTIRGMTEATIVNEGSVTLPAAKLHEIARSLPDSEVKFKLMDRNQVAISCERTRYKISGQPRDEFPNFPEVDTRNGIDLPGKTLASMVEKVVFAITTEDPRYSLNGALLLVEDGRLTLVATDGHRLAFASRELGLEGSFKVIVPRKALMEIVKMTADLTDDQPVSFGQTEDQLFFICGGHKLTSGTLKGTFPRYENVMPESCDIKIVVPTLELAAAVKRVSLLASDRLGRAVSINLMSGKLEMKSRTEMGEADEALQIDYDGPEMTIGFNARYLIDFLSVVGSDEVSMEFNPGKGEGAEGRVEAGDKPGQLRPHPGDELDYRYIVMPMHL